MKIRYEFCTAKTMKIARDIQNSSQRKKPQTLLHTKKHIKNRFKLPKGRMKLV